MAGIQTSISLADNMTTTIRSMSNALNMIIGNFAELQRTSSTAIDLSSLTAAQRELAAASVHVDKMENDIRQAAAEQDTLNNKMREGGSAASGLVSKIGGIVATYASWKSVMGLTSATDQYTGITSRLDMINDGLQTTQELQEKVRASANATRSSYQSTADMVGKLGIQAGDAFSNSQDIINFAEQINKHLAIAGTSTAAAEGAMVQMTQAMSNGVLRGEELNSVMDGMPTVTKAIAQEFARMGDTRPLKAIAEDGLITADIVKRALYNAADETNAKFKGMGMTFAGLWNIFSNNADKALTPVYEKMKQLAGSETLQSFVASAGQAVATVAGMMVWAFDILASIGGFVASNWDIIAPVIYAVAGSMAVYNGALLISNTLTTINTFLTSNNIAKKFLFATASFLCTLATSGFSAALATLNITLGSTTMIIGFVAFAIFAVIAAIYIGVAVFNHFAGTSISATGLIAGAFMWLFALIGNIFISIGNAALVFVEFLINVMTGAVSRVMNAFVYLGMAGLQIKAKLQDGWASFANTFKGIMIGAINDVIGAWNKLIDLLPEKVKTTLGLEKGELWTMTETVSSGDQTREQASELAKKMVIPEAANLGRFNYLDMGAAYDSGYKWGENLSNTFSLGGDSPITNPQMTAAEMTKNAGLGADSPASQIADNTGKTATNTAKVNDTMTATDEEIKYMRDIAEREVINRFTTAEIKVDVQNNNNISNGLDLDGVISGFTSKVYDAMAIAAEGVHR